MSESLDAVLNEVETGRHLRLIHQVDQHAAELERLKAVVQFLVNDKAKTRRDPALFDLFQREKPRASYLAWDLEYLPTDVESKITDHSVGFRLPSDHQPVRRLKSKHHVVSLVLSLTISTALITVGFISISIKKLPPYSFWWSMGFPAGGVALACFLVLLRVTGDECAEEATER